MLTPEERDLGGLAHRVRGLDGADETLGLDEAERDLGFGGHGNLGVLGIKGGWSAAK